MYNLGLLVLGTLVKLVLLILLLLVKIDDTFLAEEILARFTCINQIYASNGFASVDNVLHATVAFAIFPLGERFEIVEFVGGVPLI